MVDFVSSASYPTDPSKTFKLQNLHIIRRSPDLETLNLWKGRSGSYIHRATAVWLLQIVLLVFEVIPNHSKTDKKRSVHKYTSFFPKDFNTELLEVHENILLRWELSDSERQCQGYEYIIFLLIPQQRYLLDLKFVLWYYQTDRTFTILKPQDTSLIKRSLKFVKGSAG